MQAVNRSALKLIVILTLVCLYSFVSFADSGKPAGPPPPASDSTTPAHGELTDAAPQATSPCDPTAVKASLFGMTPAEAECRSSGCVTCHRGIEDIHNYKVNLGCIDCHGGHAEIPRPD